MAFLQNDVLGVVLTRVPAIHRCILNSELTAASGNIGFAPPDQIVAITLHILTGPVIERGPQLHIIGKLCNRLFICIAQPLIGQGAQRQGLGISFQN